MSAKRRPWTAADIPDLHGRRAIVTGANSGLGFAIARELAVHGADVVLACRDEGRGSSAVAAIRAESPTGSVRLEILDLADLGSVREFAARWTGPLDLLVNNAGVMGGPFGRTVDGFERQFGTNHLGHVALSAALLPALESASGRLVGLGSLAHRLGRVPADPNAEAGYRPLARYGGSKLAVLLFIRELDRRLRSVGSPVVAVSAHPGMSATNLVTGATGRRGAGARLVLAAQNRVLPSAAEGALPELYAATMPLAGGSALAPGRFFELYGPPARATLSRAARDDAEARRVWNLSVALTGARFQF